MAMSKKLSLLVIFFLTISSFGFAVEISGSIDYVNRYIWRGFDLNPDNKFVIQPSIDFTFGDSPWSINLWHNYSENEKNVNELDLTFDYAFQNTKDVAVSIGFTHYAWYWVKNFKEETNTSHEGYVALTWEKAPLTPSLTLYHDFKNGNGFYAQLGLSKEISISEKQNIVLSSTFGYNRKQWISDSGLSDASVRLDIPIKAGKHTITPYAGITWPLLKVINPGVAREYWLGVSFSF